MICWSCAVITAGIATGSALPRGDEEHGTPRGPPKISLLMANIISIILRAVCLGFLSSFSKDFSTWQKSHSTPNDAVMNCIVGNSCSAGTPLSTWIFLNCCSAVLGAFADAGAVAGAFGPDCALT